MPYHRREIPVAAYKRRIWIITSKYPVIHTINPHIVLISLPSDSRLRARDLCAQRLFTSIGNAGILSTCIYRIYRLPVDSWCNDNLIPGSCRLCCIIDVSERCLFTAVSLLRRDAIDINLHSMYLRFQILSEIYSSAFYSLMFVLNWLYLH